MACSNQPHTAYKNDSSRHRKPNFTDAEVRVLLEEVKKHKNTIIFRKNCNSSERKQREAVFKHITEKVNEVTKGTCGRFQRNMKEVVKKWADLKYEAMSGRPKTNSNYKITSKISPVTQLVLDIMSTKHEIKPKSSEYILDNSDIRVRSSDGHKGGELPSHTAYSSCTTTSFTPFSVKEETEGSGHSIIMEVKNTESSQKQNLTYADHFNYAKAQTLPSPSHLRQLKKAETVERKRKQNFTTEEVKILLEVIKKHRDCVLKRMSIHRVRQEWMQILHEYHEKSGLSVHTLPEIRKKWHCLKFEVLKDKRKRDDARANGLFPHGPETLFAEEVLNILELGIFDCKSLTEVPQVDFTEKMNLDASAGSPSSVYVPHHPYPKHSDSLMESTSTRSDSRQTHIEDIHIGMQECAFPKRNICTTTELTEEECDCLVTEIDKFKDVLLATTCKDSSDVIHSKQRQAWRLVTEKVNKCVTKSFRWTARQLQNKWEMLQQQAEKHHTDILAGKSQILNSALSERMLRIMQVLVSSHRTQFSQHETNGQTPKVQSVQLGLDTNRCSSRLQEKSANPRPGTWKHYQPDTDSDLVQARKRSRNFTNKEVDIMLTVIEANQEVFGTKKKDMHTLGRKLHIAQSIVNELNKFSGRKEQRTLSQVQHKVKHLKAEAVKWQQTRESGLVEVDDRQPSVEQLDRIVRVMLCDEHTYDIGGGDGLMEDAGIEQSADSDTGRNKLFTQEEVDIMLDMYEANRDILKCEKRDRKTYNRKLVVFQDIVDRLNCRPGLTQFTVEHVKKKLANLKQKAFKLSRFKQSNQTEGWHFPSDHAIYERVLSIMDCDSPTCDDSSESGQDDNLEGMKDGKEISETYEKDVQSDVALVQVYNPAKNGIETSVTEIVKDNITNTDDGFVDSGKLTEQLEQLVECQSSAMLQENATDTGVCTDSPSLPARHKRQRDKNFSQEEVDIMLDIYEENRQVLNCSRNDTLTVSKKMAIIQNMTDRLNSCSGEHKCCRTVGQVKRKLRSLKLDSRKMWQKYQAGEHMIDPQSKVDMVTIKRVLHLMGAIDDDEVEKLEGNK